MGKIIGTLDAIYWLYELVNHLEIGEPGEYVNFQRQVSAMGISPARYRDFHVNTGFS